jgi:hypothetical protein
MRLAHTVAIFRLDHTTLDGDAMPALPAARRAPALTEMF